VWTVKPGGPYRVTTALNVDVINAGDAIEVTCRAFDEYGNRTEDDTFDISVSPAPRRLSQRGSMITLEGSGRYEVQCTVPGAEQYEPAPIEIRAGLPAALSISLFPDRPIYRTGSVLEVIPQVTDALGNPVGQVALAFASEPPLPTFGEGRFLADEPGEYLLTVQVTSPTEDDVELLTTQSIVVAFDGPGIDCVSPEMGEVIVRAPGQMQTLSGRVTQVNELRSITVDGQLVNHNPADGRWRIDRPVVWGLNIFPIEVDAGEDGIFRSFCAFYASERFGDGTQLRPDMLILRLGQDGFDDGPPNRPLQSIGDALRRVLNAPGLQTTVDQAAMAQNPLVPKECRARIFGACIFRLGVDYKGYENRGPNDINIDLVEGGVRLRISFRDQHVRAKFTGTLGNTARVRASEIVVDVTFDARLGNNGQPDIRLRSLNEVSVGRLSADFSGLLGFVFELVFNAFRGLIERTVTDALRGFVESNIDRVLTDLFGNIDVGALGSGFDVPGLSGGDPVRLVLNGELSTLDFTDNAVLIGLATQVDGPLNQGDRGLGLPLLPDEDDVRVQDDRSVGALVRLTVLNQVLYRLWRAGYFQAQSDGLDDEIAGQLPDNVSAQLRFPQPPWVTGVDGENRVQVHLGPVSAGVTPRGSAEIRLEAAAIISASVRLENETDLVYEGVRIDRLALNFFGADYVIQIREIVQDTIERLLEGVVNRALNDGLPSLPIPEFVIPAGLEDFDLPAGLRLGLRQPRLTGLVPAWILDGNLGE
ncbi:MAG: hypothetical protein VX589_10575, partial [Myxococcota bacterium]|nr:hypothetical protein [Myxococcota bacterium]